MMTLGKFVSRFWILLGLIVTSIIDLVLLGLLLGGWHGSERLATAITTKRTTIVVVVQIIAHTLGMIMVQSLCTLLKIHFSASTILSKPVTFEHVRFLEALSYPKLLLSKDWSLTISTILFALATLVPGAMWSGAISPSIVTQNVTADFPIPAYPVNNLSAVFDAGDTQNEHGDFSFDPFRYTSVLVTSAQQSTNRNGSNQDLVPHAKLDYTGYTYLTRSFGTGATVGLFADFAQGQPLSYSYIEPGIVANVTCFRNSSSDFTINYNASSYNPSGWLGTTGVTSGSYPSGKSVGAYWLFGAMFADMFAIEADYNATLRQGEVIMTSAGDTWQQKQFDHIQCGLTFQAYNIEVSVNTVQKAIMTSIRDQTAWPAYGDNITEKSMIALRALSMTDNGFAGSRVGRALWVNAAKLNYLNTGNYSTVDIADDIIFQSVSDFVVSVFENTLVGLGSCRAECAYTTKTVTANVEVHSVIYGAARFIYIITALNFLLVFVTLYMVVLRRPWRWIVNLDFGDPADIALNASRGGSTLFYQFANHDPGLDTRFTLQDPHGRWPGIVPGWLSSSNNHVQMQMQMQNPQWNNHVKHNTSISTSRLLGPEYIR